jgi:hypothetical protein
MVTTTSGVTAGFGFTDTMRSCCADRRQRIRHPSQAATWLPTGGAAGNAGTHLYSELPSEQNEIVANRKTGFIERRLGGARFTGFGVVEKISG